LTRAELTRKIHEAHGGLTMQAAKQLVDGMFDLLMDGLVKEGHVVISGFGTFRVVLRRERRGWDIGKRSPVKVPARRDVVFVPSRRAAKHTANS
jgi:nucleoid DNA-binding protein